MDTRIRYVIFILIVVGALIGVLFMHSTPQVKNNVSTGSALIVKDVRIPVSVANTPETRNQGLSGTTALPSGTGKFFIFDTADRYGFWMKDMNYSLDLVWIDTDLRIVSVTENVKPETYPTVFYPPGPVQYVLEVNAGESSVLGLKAGVQLIFEK